VTKALDISKAFDKAAFREWLDSIDHGLTNAEVRKATSAAVNGQAFVSPTGRDGDMEAGPGEWAKRGGKQTSEGTALLSTLIARFWEPLFDEQKLDVWKDYSVKALREYQKQEFAIGPDHQDLSLPPGVRVKIGEKTESGYPDGDGIAYYKNRSKSEGSQVATGGVVSITSVDAAKDWAGWKSHQLKPAFEFIIIARKPMSEEPIHENVKKLGVGGYNINAGRIPFAGDSPVELYGESWGQSGRSADDAEDFWGEGNLKNNTAGERVDSQGRFPANLISSDGVMGEADKFFSLDRWAAENGFDEDWVVQAKVGLLRIAKPSKSEKTCNGEVENRHSTVKPVALFGWLLALGCPPGGLMLDPFVGSGSSLVAAIRGGWRYIGIDQDQHYCSISRARTAYAEQEAKQYRLF